ncbi:MAG TPA: DUF3347 domain-containing protein [Bacteroidetes bacterium]|nr:DUF3347 domain-containing protein [Bacteroidota bacterium]
MRLKKYLFLFLISITILSCFQQRDDVKKAMKTVVSDSGVDPTFKKNLAKLMTHYFKLKEACVNNDQTTAKSISTIMKKNINKIDISALSNKDFYAWSKQQTSLDYILSEIARGSDIKNSRINFQDLHSPLYKILTTFGMNSGPIYVQHCPMAFENAGANWLSDNENITNPYFGDKMLECGTNTEVISFE